MLTSDPLCIELSPVHFEMMFLGYVGVLCITLAVLHTQSICMHSELKITLNSCAGVYIGTEVVSVLNIIPFPFLIHILLLLLYN